MHKQKAPKTQQFAVRHAKNQWTFLMALASPLALAIILLTWVFQLKFLFLRNLQFLVQTRFNNIYSTVNTEFMSLYTCNTLFKGRLDQHLTYSHVRSQLFDHFINAGTWNREFIVISRGGASCSSTCLVSHSDLLTNNKRCIGDCLIRY